jgi:hypothetical protein
MKKIIFFIAIASIVSPSFSQTANSWRLGVHLTSINNPSYYSGGSAEANALFNQRDFGSGALGVTWRYFYNEHWSLQSGLAFGSLGFEFSMAKDYSLMNKGSQYAVNRAGFGTAQIPLTVLYDFKPNCNNVRFFVGAGISVLSRTNTTEQTVNKEPNGETPVSASVLYLNQTVNSGKSTSLTGQFMFGVEKNLKHGGMLQLGLLFNKGTNDIASTTVNYNVNNTAYSHNFTNRGDYWGLTLGYYFKEHQKK